MTPSTSSRGYEGSKFGLAAQKNLEDIVLLGRVDRMIASEREFSFALEVSNFSVGNASCFGLLILGLLFCGLHFFGLAKPSNRLTQTALLSPIYSSK